MSEENSEIVQFRENTTEILPKEENDPFFGIKDIRQRIKSRVASLDHSFILLAKDLYEVSTNDNFKDWGYETFHAYAHAELKFIASVADRYRNTAAWYMKDAGIPIAKLYDIGFHEAKSMVGVINKENADIWLDKARTLNEKSFRREIRKAKELLPKSKCESVVDTSNIPALPTDKLPLTTTVMVDNGHDIKPLEDKDQLVSYTFYLRSGQLQFLKECLGEMARRFGNTKEGYNLMCAVQGYMSTQLEKDSMQDDKPNLYRFGYEKRFGGKLVWLKTEEQITAAMKLFDNEPDLFEGAMIDD